MDQTSVSAIVVTHNSLPYLCRCVQQLLESDFPNLQLVLVDNASRDRTREYIVSLPESTIKVFLDRNRGYSVGANIGVQWSTGSILFFLNPDVYVGPDTVRLVARLLEEEPDVGAVGCKCLFPDGRTVQHAGTTLDDLAIPGHIGRGEVNDGSFDTRLDCPYVHGAAMAIRRRDFIELGGFDEIFTPAYYEDTDLCRRLWERGKRSVYFPKAVVIHEESHVLGSLSFAFLKCFHRSRLRYLFKHTPRTRRSETAAKEIRWLVKDRPKDGRTLWACFYAYAWLMLFVVARSFQRRPIRRCFRTDRRSEQASKEAL